MKPFGNHSRIYCSWSLLVWWVKIRTIKGDKGDSEAKLPMKQLSRINRPIRLYVVNKANSSYRASALGNNWMGIKQECNYKPYDTLREEAKILTGTYPWNVTQCRQKCLQLQKFLRMSLQTKDIRHTAKDGITFVTGNIKKIWNY